LRAQSSFRISTPCLRHGFGAAKTKVARKIRTHRIGVDGASA
jgi:hypothetical protein